MDILCERGTRIVRTVAVIPIKLNNERLANKNILQLGERPLLHYIQETLNSVSHIQEKYIFCSNPEVKPYLLHETRFLQRPEFLDANTTNFTQIFSEFMKQVDADIYVYTHATAPLLTKESIEACIGAVESGEYDSAFTATEIKDFLWMNGQAVNFDPCDVPRSQDLPAVYRETSGVYVFRKEVFTKYGRRVGRHPFIRTVSAEEATDINTAEDFEMARKLVKPFNEH